MQAAIRDENWFSPFLKQGIEFVGLPSEVALSYDNGLAPSQRGSLEAVLLAAKLFRCLSG